MSEKLYAVNIDPGFVHSKTKPIGFAERDKQFYKNKVEKQMNKNGKESSITIKAPNTSLITDVPKTVSMINKETDINVLQRFLRNLKKQEAVETAKYNNSYQKRYFKTPTNPNARDNDSASMKLGEYSYLEEVVNKRIAHLRSNAKKTTIKE